MTKPKRPEDKIGGGRPTLMTPDTLNKLNTAFARGASDLEACFYAGIGKTALYNYQKAHPEFAEKKEALRDSLIFKARGVVEDAIAEGDKDMAKWYLERKKKSEFTTRQEVTGADGSSLMSGVVVEFVGVEDEAKDPDSEESSVPIN